jgi:hypothetical protein
MKSVRVMAVFLVCSACTTMKPVEIPPAQLSGQIIQEGTIKSGEWVKIGTLDGTFHEFQVKTIARDHISSDTEDIAIADIATLEIREATTVGKATGSAAAFSLGYGFMAGLGAIVALIATAGL